MRDHFGRKNPNKKYFFDEGFFNKIVSEEKAYFLGWIASDGYIGENNFSLYINKKDVYILEQLKNLICPEIPITIRIKKMSEYSSSFFQSLFSSLLYHTRFSRAK